MKSMHMAMMIAVSVAVLSVRADVKIEKNISEYASIEEGQIVQGTYPTQSNGVPRADHVWVQRMFAGFNASALFNPLPIKTNLGLEMRMSNEFPRMANDFGKTRRLYFYPYLTEADLMYYIGDSSRPLFSVTAGYFPIKYNRNSRNLGEYLFRSGTYPQYLVTDFDFAATRLAGLNLSYSPITGLNLNVILNSNIEWQAIGDLNLSCLASYNFQDIFEIGAGVTFASIVSADPKITNGDINQVTNVMEYLKPNGDTAMLTFRGTKLMGMVSFDPKKLLRSDILGKEDLKLYAEAAVLGVQNYPATLDSSVTHSITTIYDDIMQRIPVMFGFNVPTFKLLDVFSIEGEWFGSRRPNDMGAVVKYNQPIQIPGDKMSYYLKDTATVSHAAHQQYIDDDWKWSVYAKRTLAGHFQIIGQIASDHMRWFAQDWRDQDWEEALRNPSQFYYRFKLAYLF
jgi:hypothetical protein